jgi:hypothetical protein
MINILKQAVQNYFCINLIIKSTAIRLLSLIIDDKVCY